MKTQLFFGGVPTKPDVDKLRKAFPELTEGEVVTHEQIEETIGYKRDTSRFRVVFTAWRKSLLAQDNIHLASVRGEGYKVADPSTRVQDSVSGLKIARRKIVRSCSLAATTDRKRLSESEKKAADHLAGLPARLRLAEISAPKPLD